jgi:hypothetical protein
MPMKKPNKAYVTLKGQGGGFAKKAKVFSAILLGLVATHQIARAQSCAPVSSGLVDWWPGNGNANDIVGTNNGVIPDTNAVSFGPGEVGEAFVFSGVANGDTGNEVDFGTSVGNFGTNNFTIDFWIKEPSNAPDAYGILEKRPNCGPGLSMFDIRSGAVALPGSGPGQLCFEVAGNNPQSGEFIANHFVSHGIINDGNFHHAAFVRNGLTDSIYIDGILDCSNTVAAISYVSNSATLRAGQTTCVGIANNLPFVGELDELDLWNRALSPGEIAAIYQAGSAGKCTAPPASNCAPVSSGLVDWWPANGNANDIVGTNNGVIPDTNEVSFGPGEVGEAFVFSGVASGTAGNEVDFGTNAGNFGTNDVTIDFWIKMPSNAPGAYAVLGKLPRCGDPIINFWHLRIGPVNWTPLPLPGQLAFAIGNNGIVLCHLQSSNTVNDGMFHHVAIVRHGVSYSDYIDGSLDSSATASGMADINNSAIMRAGNSDCVGVDNTQPFVGELDELVLWDRALSPSEIAAIYQAGSAGKCGAPSSLPTITSQPQSLVVSAYENAAFSVTAASAQSYQWLLNGSSIPGATSSSLNIPFVTQSNLGTYAVSVSNPAGSVMSSNASLSMYPYLESPFTGSVVTGGGNATLSVVVWGSGPLTYQWYDNGTAIADATGATLALTNIQASNAGLYSVVVSSPLGSVTNIPAQVIVDVIGLYPGVTISGEVGYDYLIQSTTNLTDPSSWITITNVTLTEATQLWVDTNECVSIPTHVQRYYRVLPGP